VSHDSDWHPRVLYSTPVREGDRVGDYILDRLIGRGGMGEVWRAHDPSLGRAIALKVLTKADDDELQRLRREARTAAGLAHPGIVRIYAVGERSIAMELVDGKTLAEAKLDARRAAEAVRDAARAIAVAHAAGIVHRDLKPQNLMIDGAGHVHVMDFGLARRVEGGESLTQTGVTLGTPAYMSPEQARGERADERSDVYSLGATLYHVLTGRPPFEGATVIAILRDVLEREPRPTGARQELDAIVMKCLAKDRAERYGGAAELADDLDRWLREEPVVARSATIVKRAARVWVNWRALVAVVLLSAATVAAGYSIFMARLRAAERDADAARRNLIEEMRSTSATCLDTALQLRRLGNVAAMEEQARRLDDVCAKVIAAMPGLAEPHVRLGRMRRAQMQFARALEQQEMALAKEPGLSEARRERARLLVRQYFVQSGARQAAWRRAQAFDGGGDGDPGNLEDAEMRRLRETALGDFASVGDAEASAYALLFARDMGALAWFDRAATEPGADEEVFEVRGRIELDLQRFAEAIDWLTRGHERDLGYVPHLAWRGVARLRDATGQAVRGIDPTAMLADAERDYDQIEALGLLDSTTRHGRADVRLTRAQWMRGRGGDIEAVLRLAEKDLEVLEALPDVSVALNRGVIDLERAHIAQARGDDPAPHYRRSMSRLEEASQRFPADATVWTNLAFLRGNWGQHEATMGRDPSALYAAALQAIDEAVRLAPTVQNYRARGKLHYNVGVQAVDTRKDSKAAFAAALEDLDTALRLANGRDVESLVIKGNLRTRQAMLGGRGAVDLHRMALDDYEHAVAINPNSDMALVRRAGARATLAQFEGGDTEPGLREALADAEQACTLRPGSADAWQMRGKIRFVLAATLAARGRPAADDYREAQRAMETAVKLQASMKRELGPHIEACVKYLASGRD